MTWSPASVRLSPRPLPSRPRLLAPLLAARTPSKADGAGDLPADPLQRIGQELGHTCRKRLLAPAVTLPALLHQVLHASTACDHVPHLRGGRWTGAAAYCQARRRLPLTLGTRLFATLGSGRDQATLGEASASGCWTVPVARCPTRPNASRRSAHPTLQSPAAASRWPTSCPGGVANRGSANVARSRSR